MAKNIKKRSKESYLAKTVKGKKRQARGLKQRWPGNSGKSIPESERIS